MGSLCMLHQVPEDMEIAMSGRMVGITLVSLMCLWPSGALVAAEQVRITHNHVFPPYAEVQEGKSVGLAVDIAWKQRFVAFKVEPSAVG